MGGSFFGIEIARSALWAQQRALDMTGQNVANANTPGYSRQVARLQTTGGKVGASAGGYVGTGVQVVEINRMRSSFLERQSRNVTSDLRYWEQQEQVMKELEAIFLEPGGEGLQTAFDLWWDGLLQLANNPESQGMRQMVLQRGFGLIETFKGIDRNLTSLQHSLEAALKDAIDQVNVLAEQVARLNADIVKLEARGQQANDLLDRRDLLLTELAELFSVNVAATDTNSVQVWLGGRLLVSGSEFNRLSVADGEDSFEVTWSRDDAMVALPDTGRIASLSRTLDAKAGVIAKYREQLLGMATMFSNEINAVHAGVDEDVPDIFIGLPVDNEDDDIDYSALVLVNWDLNPLVVDDPGLLRAGDSPAPGDGSRALAMASLRHLPFSEYGYFQDVPLPLGLPADSTLADVYAGIIGDLGIRAQEAERQTINSQALLIQVKSQQDSVSGVSLDEEMTNMLRFEHAYAAAARMLTTMDTLLDTLINRTGLVGR